MVAQPLPGRHDTLMSHATDIWCGADLFPVAKCHRSSKAVRLSLVKVRFVEQSCIVWIDLKKNLMSSEPHSLILRLACMCISNSLKFNMLFKVS